MYKVGLVSRGLFQKYEENYDEIFSLVTKITIVRLLISLATSFSWRLWQLYVKNDFINGEVDNKILMEK